MDYHTTNKVIHNLHVDFDLGKKNKFITTMSVLPNVALGGLSVFCPTLPKIDRLYFVTDTHIDARIKKV